jgi:hypothetical protein
MFFYFFSSIVFPETNLTPSNTLTYVPRFDIALNSISGPFLVIFLFKRSLLSGLSIKIGLSSTLAYLSFMTGRLV